MGFGVLIRTWEKAALALSVPGPHPSHSWVASDSRKARATTAVGIALALDEATRGPSLPAILPNKKPANACRDGEQQEKHTVNGPCDVGLPL